MPNIVPNQEMRQKARQRQNWRFPRMYHSWRDVFFVHWEFPIEEIQKTLPEGLWVDTFQNKAYIGMVALSLENIRFSLFPSLPGLSSCLDITLRTYVYDDQGRPGIWFYGMAANSWLGAQYAKCFFYLPYEYAQIEHSKKQYSFNYSEENTRYTFGYETGENIGAAHPETLDFFVMERYQVFVIHGLNKKLYSCHVWHPPFERKKTRISYGDSSFLGHYGLKEPSIPPAQVAYSSGVDVEIFSLQNNLYAF